MPIRTARSSPTTPSGGAAPQDPTGDRTWALPGRSSRHGGPGLAGLAALSGAAVLFAVLLLLVRGQWAPLESLDHGLATGLNRLVAPHAALVDALRAVTTLGSNMVLWWTTALATLLLLLRRRLRLALYLVVSGCGSLVLDPTLKLAVGRLRPVVADPIAHGRGNSFPSGHALGSIVCYGALLLVFLPALPRRARRPALIAAAALVAVIGASRILLGVHYLSDVVGAWSLGVAWLGVTAYAFELWRRETGDRTTAPLAEGLEPESAGDLKLAGEPGPAAGVRPVGGTGRSSWAADLGRFVAGTAVGWVLVFGAVTGLGELVVRYGGGDVLGDETVPHLLAAHRSGPLDEWSRLVSQAGNAHAILAVGLVVGAVALATIRRWRPVIFLAVVMFGELSLFLAVAGTVGRPRPDVPHLDHRLPTSSFPSGHVAATICLYTAIVILVMPRTGRWWRWLSLVPAVVMPTALALARMYRGMHHPTDVLGSVLLAAAWLTTVYLTAAPNADLRAGATGRAVRRRRGGAPSGV